MYWYCLELIAGKVDKDNVTFELEHDARVIARNAGCTAQKTEEMMRYFVSLGLFEDAGGVITCLKMAKRLDKSMTSNQEMRKVIESMGSNNTTLEGFVYFIEKRDSTGGVVAIKIGRSKNPSARLTEISKLDENIGFSLSLAHRVKSDNCVALETELHRKFKDLNIYNEWFLPNDAIYREINPDYVMTTTRDVMQEENRLEENREIILSADADRAGRNEKAKQVPHQAVIDLYHKHLPMLTRTKVWSERRKKALKARWFSGLSHPEHGGIDGLAWWDAYFAYAAKCPLLVGDNDREWKADLEWLINEANLIKVIEGKYAK